MKLFKTIIIGIIGIFVGAASVYAYTGSHSETNGTKSTPPAMDHSTMSQSEFNLNNEEQRKDSKPTMPGQEALELFKKL
mgnify:CR=1 FL=1